MPKSVDILVAKHVFEYELVVGHEKFCIKENCPFAHETHALRIPPLAPDSEWRHNFYGRNEDEVWNQVPDFSEKMECAWPIVEKMRERGFRPTLTLYAENDWRCGFTKFGTEIEETCWGAAVHCATPSLAISLASLRALGVEVPA